MLASWALFGGRKDARVGCFMRCHLRAGSGSTSADLLAQVLLLFFWRVPPVRRDGDDASMIV